MNKVLYASKFSVLRAPSKRTANFSGFLPVTVTFAPSLAKWTAVARPIPSEEPVQYIIFTCLRSCFPYSFSSKILVRRNIIYYDKNQRTSNKDDFLVEKWHRMQWMNERYELWVWRYPLTLSLSLCLSLAANSTVYTCAQIIWPDQTALSPFPILFSFGGWRLLSCDYCLHTSR